jgi:hypothetical protein
MAVASNSPVSAASKRFLFNITLVGLTRPNAYGALTELVTATKLFCFVISGDSWSMVTHGYWVARGQPPSPTMGGFAQVQIALAASLMSLFSSGRKSATLIFLLGGFYRVQFYIDPIYGV